MPKNRFVERDSLIDSINMKAMLTTSGLVKLACALLTILGQSARADTWYLLDFDGTAVDDQSPRSTWHRMWHLKCVESLRNSAQINPQALGLPDVVPVTYREVRRLMPMLARGPAELNWPHPVALDADPLHPERQLEIIPGCYAVSRDRTFGEYRPAVGGESHLLRVLDEAERRAVMMNDAFAREHGREPDATERFGWDGPAMPLIRQAMSKRGSVERLAFFTASNHLPWEWDGFFKKLRALKRIRHAHGMDRHGGRTVPHVFSVKDPESIFFGRAGMVEIKGNITRALSQNIAGLSVGKHFELSPDPREAAGDCSGKVTR